MDIVAEQVVAVKTRIIRPVEVDEECMCDVIVRHAPDLRPRLVLLNDGSTLTGPQLAPPSVLSADSRCPLPPAYPYGRVDM